MSYGWNHTKLRSNILHNILLTLVNYFGVIFQKQLRPVILIIFETTYLKKFTTYLTQEFIFALIFWRVVRKISVGKILYPFSNEQSFQTYPPTNCLLQWNRWYIQCYNIYNICPFLTSKRKTYPHLSVHILDRSYSFSKCEGWKSSSRILVLMDFSFRNSVTCNHGSSTHLDC